MRSINLGSWTESIPLITQILQIWRATWLFCFSNRQAEGRILPTVRRQLAL